MNSIETIDSNTNLNTVTLSVNIKLDAESICDNNNDDTPCNTNAINNDIKNIQSNINVNNSLSINDENLSKKQKKKILKKLHWDSIKGEKRKEEKRRRKEKRKFNISNNIPVKPSRKMFKHRKMIDSECKLKVAIDCGFEDYMTDKGIAHVVQQLQYCYSVNRRAENSIQLYFAGVNGRLHDRFSTIGDVKGWDINYDRRNYDEIFDKNKIIYLSSESENELVDLDEDVTYVIGGLIDYNHHKGLCHRLAKEKNINHARLPIEKYLNLYTRHVLTINHVFEILLKFTENKDWSKSLSEVIPQRKAAEVKELIDTVQDDIVQEDTKQEDTIQTIPTETEELNTE